MSFGNRFKPARGLLTGVALENNDQLAAAVPAEELPVETPTEELPAGDAVDAAANAVAPEPAAPVEATPVDAVAPVVTEPAAAPEAEVVSTEEPVVAEQAPAAAVEETPTTTEQAPTEPAPTETAAPTADPVEAQADPIQEDAIEEMQEADAAIAQDDEVIEQAMVETAEETNKIADGADNVQELDAIADALEETMDEGGAPASTIAVANIAVEHAIARMNGGFKPKRLLPAQESFGGLRSKAVSTQLAIESLRGAANTAGEKIMLFIHKCIDFLKNLLTKFMDGFEAMKKKLAALAQAAKQGKLVQGGVKISNHIVSRLKIGGKFSKQLFIKGLKNVQGFIAKIAALLGVSAKTSKEVNLLEGPQAEGAENMFPPLDLGPVGAAVKAFGGKTTEAEEGTVTVTYLEALPGDASAHVTGPDATVVGDVAYRAASSIDVNITNVASEETFVEVDETVTEAEFAQMIRQMEQAIKDAEGLRNTTATVIDAEASIVKMVGVASKKEQVLNAGRKFIAGMQNFASRIASSLTRAISKSIAYVRSVLTVGLQYLASFVTTPTEGNDSVKQLQGPKVANESYALGLEGFMGGLKGYALGYITLGFQNPKMRQKAEEVKKEISKTAAEIARLRGQEIKSAGSDETVPEKEQIIKYGFTDFLFAPIKGAAAGSKLENLQKELKKLTAELQTVVQEGGGKVATA